MLQILLYTVTAILLYLVSDWILAKMEEYRGKPFVSRSLVFFMIILILSVIVFESVQRFLISDSEPQSQESISTEKVSPNITTPPTSNTTK